LKRIEDVNNSCNGMKRDMIRLLSPRGLLSGELKIATVRMLMVLFTGQHGSTTASGRPTSATWPATSTRSKDDNFYLPRERRIDDPAAGPTSRSHPDAAHARRLLGDDELLTRRHDEDAPLEVARGAR
jgi:hypothetical protein